MDEKIIEDVVVETVEGTVEDSVLDSAATNVSEAANDSSVTGAIIAGVISVFGAIGVIATVKKIKTTVSNFIAKRKEKKAAKLAEEARKAAIEDAKQHPENYYTEDDVKEEVVDEVK